MKPASRPEIERRAKEILAQQGLYSLPINPVHLANRLGVTVNNAKFTDDSLAALISRRSYATRIFVEQSDPPYRKRFSIAHGLGHHFLHLKEDEEIADKRGDMFQEREPSLEPVSEDRIREIQANWFAVALLMPMELVREEWNRNSGMLHMARVFNVSEEAIGRRVDALDLWAPTNGR